MSNRGVRRPGACARERSAQQALLSARVDGGLISVFDTITIVGATGRHRPCHLLQVVLIAPTRGASEFSQGVLYLNYVALIGGGARNRTAVLRCIQFSVYDHVQSLLKRLASLSSSFHSQARHSQSRDVNAHDPARIHCASPTSSRRGRSGNGMVAYAAIAGAKAPMEIGLALNSADGP